MRTVDIEIGGHTYPLCLTLWAYGQICDRYESMAGCLRRLDEVAGEFERSEETGKIKVIRPEDTPALIEEYLWLLEQLMTGGKQASTDFPGIVPRGQLSLPNREQLRAVLCPGDIPYVQTTVLLAITAGQAREVGTQSPKNGAGAAGGQAPES